MNGAFDYTKIEFQLNLIDFLQKGSEPQKIICMVNF